MHIPFYKMQGTGNDFIIIDNRRLKINSQKLNIKNLCDRKFGIGADGLLLINSSRQYDFEMKYFNSDGKLASMCGNGGRCITYLAKKLNVIKNKTTFLAADGIHRAEIKNDSAVRLQMKDVSAIKKLIPSTRDEYFLNTGSPHFVRFINGNIYSYPVFEEGRKIRNRKEYKAKGVNANFVKVLGKNKIFVRTYERGVEDETLSCGTGVVASALAYIVKCKMKNARCTISISTPGGKLKVSAERTAKGFQNILFGGKVSIAFAGIISV